MDLASVIFIVAIVLYFVFRIIYSLGIKNGVKREQANRYAKYNSHRSLEAESAIKRAVSAEREKAKTEMAKFFRDALLTNTITGEPITCMDDFKVWKAAYDKAVSQHSKGANLENVPVQQPPPQKESKLNKSRAISESEFEKQMMEREGALNLREAQLKERVQMETKRNIIDIIESAISRKPYISAPVYQALLSKDFDYYGGRIHRAVSENMIFSGGITGTVWVVTESNKRYEVSLSNCKCPDFNGGERPCKHMLRLGIELGILASIDMKPILKELSDGANEYDRKRKAYVSAKRKGIS